MIKAILFDLDGVVILKQEKLFSQRFAEKMNLPYEKVLEFFLNDFRECSFGKADLREKIVPYLLKWNYKGTVDEFLEFWFQSENNIDEEVLDIVSVLRLKNIKCYMATQQEKYRKDFILNKMELKNHFDGIFCSCDIGYGKWQKEYWDYVFSELKLKPEEIAFFCDSEKNIESANSLGIRAYFYQGVSFMKDNLEKLNIKI